MTQNRDNCIILSKRQHKEADLIISFLGEKLGKGVGIARSSLLSSRRFGGGLEPGTIAELKFRNQKGRWQFIEELDVVLPAVGCMKSMQRFGAVMRALELALAFLHEAEPAYERYLLLKRYIEYLSAKEPVLADMIAFDLAWLKLSGYAPMLSNCANCMVSESPSWSVASKDGGLACLDCSKKIGARPFISDQAREKAKSSQDGIAVSWSNAEAGEIDTFIQTYIAHILGRTLSGRQILGEMGK